MAAQRIEIIAGPTASGKSGLAVQRALAANGTVINADSMQIYNALPMLTAQPDAADRAAVPHRLYGILDPAGQCSAAHWRGLAIAEIEQTLQEGRTPIVTGGTGLYINSLLNGLSPMPDVPAAIRAETVALQAGLGNPGFHAALDAIDPVMAGRLHPNDTQRLIRAYEVMKATNRSLAAWQAAPREGPPAGWAFHVTLVLPERGALYARCNARFDAMMEQGVPDEVGTFMAKANIAGDAPIKHALGYRPLSAYLRKELSRDDAVEQAKAETRQYAKRQVTWFRHQIKPAENIMEISVIS